MIWYAVNVISDSITIINSAFVLPKTYRTNRPGFEFVDCQTAAAGTFVFSAHKQFLYLSKNKKLRPHAWDEASTPCYHPNCLFAEKRPLETFNAGIRHCFHSTAQVSHRTRHEDFHRSSSLCGVGLSDNSFSALLYYLTYYNTFCLKCQVSGCPAAGVAIWRDRCYNQW